MKLELKEQLIKGREYQLIHYDDYITGVYDGIMRQQRGGDFWDFLLFKYEPGYWLVSPRCRILGKTINIELHTVKWAHTIDEFKEIPTTFELKPYD